MYEALVVSGVIFWFESFFPRACRRDEDLIGLLGKPNGNARDDWVAKEGTVLSAPSNDRDSIFAASYNYCVDNWCAQSDVESIFSFRSDESFAFTNKCGEMYSDEVETAVNEASQALKDVCGDNLFCLLDGVCGSGIDDAQQGLADNEEVEETQSQVASREPITVAPVEPVMPMWSPAPSSMPTHSELPTFYPSTLPNEVPSSEPSEFPNNMPSEYPSTVPNDFQSSTLPNEFPSTVPNEFQSSALPSSVPSNVPSEFPNNTPVTNIATPAPITPAPAVAQSRQELPGRQH